MTTKIKNAASIAFAVLTAVFWTCVPRRFMSPDRPFQRRGVRYIRYTDYTGSGAVHAIHFNQGSGYIGGATLYWARRCRIRRPSHGFRPAAFSIGLTDNANNVPLPGRY